MLCLIHEGTSTASSTGSSFVWGKPIVVWATNFVYSVNSSLIVKLYTENPVQKKSLSVSLKVYGNLSHTATTTTASTITTAKTPPFLFFGNESGQLLGWARLEKVFTTLAYESS